MRRILFLLLAMIFAMQGWSQSCSTPPTDLAVGEITSSSICVRWSKKVDYEKIIIVYDSVNQLKPDTLILTDKKPYCIVNDLIPETKYRFYIHAVCGLGESAVTSGKSVTVEGTTKNSTCDAPLIAGSATTIKTNLIGFGYTSQGNYKSILVYYSYAGQSKPMVVRKSSTESLYTLDNLLPNKEYTIRLRGECMDGGLTKYSDPLKVTTNQSSCATMPQGLVSTNQTSTTISLTWTKKEDYKELIVSYGIDGSEILKSFPINEGTESITITSLKSLSTYNIKVRAICITGDTSAYTSFINVSTKDSQCKSVPTGLISSSQTTTSIAFKWDKRSDYKTIIYTRSIKGGAMTTVSTNVTAATDSINITGLLPDTLYYIKIRTVCSSSPNDTSAFTDSIAVRTLVSSCKAVPTGLVSSSQTTTSVAFKWDKKVDYKTIIYTRKIKGGAMTTVSTNVTAATDSINITGLLPDTLYYVKIRTICNSNDTSAFTDSIAIRTKVSSCKTVPTGFTVSSQSSSSIALKWDKKDDYTKILIYHAVNGVAEIPQSYVINPKTDSVGALNLNPETTYSIKIRTVCASNDTSDYSNEVTATTLKTNCTFKQFQGLAVKSKTSTSITFEHKTDSAYFSKAYVAVATDVLTGEKLRASGTISSSSNPLSNLYTSFSGLKQDTEYDFDFYLSCEAQDTMKVGSIRVRMAAFCGTHTASAPTFVGMTSNSMTWQLPWNANYVGGQYICIIYNHIPSIVDTVFVDAIDPAVSGKPNMAVYDKVQPGKKYGAKLFFRCANGDATPNGSGGLISAVAPCDNVTIAPYLEDFNQYQYSASSFEGPNDVQSAKGYRGICMQTYKNLGTAPLERDLTNANMSINFWRNASYTAPDQSYQAALRMQANKANNSNIWALSQVDIKGVNGVDFDFAITPQGSTIQSKAANVSENIQFGVLVSQDEFNTYDTLFLVKGDSLKKYSDAGHIALDLKKYQSLNNGIIRLAFALNTTSSVDTVRSVFIDNVNYRTYTNCLDVFSLDAEFLTPTSARFKWDTNNAMVVGFEGVIYNGPADDFDPEQGTKIDFVSPYSGYTISGLDPDRTYTFGVRHKCDNNNGAWSKYEISTTESDAIVKLPFVCTFDKDRDPLYWGFANKPNANRWMIGDEVNNTPDGLNAMYITGDGKNMGMLAGRFTYSTAYLDIDATEETDGQYLIQFDWRNASTSNSLGVAIGNPADPSFSYDETYRLAAPNFPKFLSQDYGYPSISGNTTYLPQGYSVGSPNNVLNGWFGQYTKPNKWYTVQIVIPGSELNGRYRRLYFVWKNDNTVTNTVGQFDNVIIRPIKCTRPKAGAVTNVQATSANITWTLSDTLFKPESYEIKCVAERTGQTLIFNAVSETDPKTYDLVGLESNTRYQVVISSKCSGNEISTVSDTLKFMTRCMPLPIPAELKFAMQGSDAETRAYYTCWDYKIGAYKGDLRDTNRDNYSYKWSFRESKFPYPTHDDTVTALYTYFGSTDYAPGYPKDEFGNYIYVPNEPTLHKWAITPEYHLGDGVEKWMLRTRVKFTQSSWDNLPNTTDLNKVERDTFAIVLSYDGGYTWDYENATVYNFGGKNGARNLLSLTGNNTFIPLIDHHKRNLVGNIRVGYFIGNEAGADQQNYMHVAEYEILPFTDCFPPTGLTASNVKTTSVQLTWNKGEGAEHYDNFKVLYRPSGKSWSSKECTGTSYLLEGLTQGVQYDIRVIPMCGENYPLDSSNNVKIVTRCSFVVDATHPWEEGFESGINCWQYTWPLSYAQSKWQVTDGGSKTGTYKLKADACYRDTMYIVSPVFDITNTENPILSLWKQQASPYWQPTEYAPLRILVRSYDPNPEKLTAGWTELVKLHGVDETYKYVRFAIPDSLKNSSFQFALHATKDNPNMADILIDDITLFEGEGMCKNPTELSYSEVTQTSAKLKWSNNEYASSVFLRINQKDTLISGRLDSTYSLTNLKANTDYIIEVKSDCDVVGKSNWELITFKTLENVHPVVTTVSVDNVKYNEATFTGVVQKGTIDITERGFKYRKQGQTTWLEQLVATYDADISATVTGLSEYTAYEFTTFATNEDGTFYGDTIKFKTPLEHAISPTISDVSVTDIAHNSAKVTATVTPGNETVLDRGVEYKLKNATTFLLQSSSTDAISELLNDLLPSSDYEYKIYVKTDVKTYYSDDKTFKTADYINPTILTDTILSITSNSALFKGTFTKGTDELTERGFKYKRSTEQNWISKPITDATSELTVNDLIPNVSYQYKAYAKIGDNVFEGVQKAFVTKSGLDDVEKGIDMSLYPNPATTEFKLVVNGVNSEAKVVITDIQGRIINTIITKPTNNKVDQSINVEGYAKGIYNVRITCENHSRTQKLIVK